MRFCKKSAQSVSEYVILITIVVAGIVAVFPMLKRGTQSLVKVTADQIGNQQGAEQEFNTDAVGYSGYLVNSDTATRTDVYRETREWPGAIQQVFNESTATSTNMFTNMGFLEN